MTGLAPTIVSPSSRRLCPKASRKAVTLRPHWLTNEPRCSTHAAWEDRFPGIVAARVAGLILRLGDLHVRVKDLTFGGAGNAGRALCPPGWRKPSKFLSTRFEKAPGAAGDTYSLPMTEDAALTRGCPEKRTPIMS